MRKIKSCMNCGEEREIAAHGLCFTCYRQGTRKAEREDERFAGSAVNPGLTKDHKKLFRGFASLMAALTDLGVYKGDVIIIRALLTPYLEPIAQYLQQDLEAIAQSLEQHPEQMNGEQKSKTPFTVHTMKEKDAK